MMCFCSSLSVRPSNWIIGCGEEEEDIVGVFKRKRRRKEDEDEDGDIEEEDAGKEEEAGQRWDTPKKGDPVTGLWRGQQRCWAIFFSPSFVSCFSISKWKPGRS